MTTNNDKEEEKLITDSEKEQESPNENPVVDNETPVKEPIKDEQPIVQPIIKEENKESFLLSPIFYKIMSIGFMIVILVIIMFLILNMFRNKDVSTNELRIGETTYKLSEVQEWSNNGELSIAEEILWRYTDFATKDFKATEEQLANHYNISVKDWQEIEKDSKRVLTNNYVESKKMQDVLAKNLDITDKKINSIIDKKNNEYILIAQLILSNEKLAEYDKLSSKEEKEKFIADVEKVTKETADKIYKDEVEHNHEHEAENETPRNVTKYGTVEFTKVFKGVSENSPFHHATKLAKGEVLTTDDGFVDTIYVIDVEKVEDKELLREIAIYETITQNYPDIQDILYAIEAKDSNLQIGKDIQQLLKEELAIDENTDMLEETIKEVIAEQEKEKEKDSSKQTENK